MTILPDRQQIATPAGEILLDILQQRHLDVLSLCGGLGECEMCLVEVLIEKDAQGRSTTGRKRFRRVLACQYPVLEDITVRLLDWRKLFG